MPTTAANAPQTLQRIPEAGLLRALLPHNLLQLNRPVGSHVRIAATYLHSTKVVCGVEESPLCHRRQLKEAADEHEAPAAKRLVAVTGPYLTHPRTDRC